MPRTTHGDRFTVTVIKEDEDHVTYELTSRVISFKVRAPDFEQITFIRTFRKLQIIEHSGLMISFLLTRFLLMISGAGARKMMYWVMTEDSKYSEYVAFEAQYDVTGLHEDLALTLSYVLENEAADILNNHLDDIMQVDETAEEGVLHEL